MLDDKYYIKDFTFSNLGLEVNKKQNPDNAPNICHKECLVP